MPLKAHSGSKTEEDREENTGLYNKQESENKEPQKRPQTNHSVPEAGKPVSKEDMINIASCDLKEFGAYMSK